MEIIIQLLLFVICTLMFVVPRTHKLALLIIGSMCMQVFIIIPSMGITRGAMIIPLCFFMSMFFQIKLSDIRPSIVYTLIVISMVALCISIVSSPHATESFGSVLDAVLSGTVKGCFALAFSFVCVNSFKDIQAALKYSYIALLVLTFFSVVQIMTGHNIAVEMMQIISSNVSERAMDINETELETGRHAIQSLCPYPAVYGYMCLISSLFHFYGYKMCQFSKQNLFISIICCMSGLFLCGRRSVFLCAIASFGSFMFLAHGFKRRVKYILVTVSFFVIVYLLIPSVQDYVGLMTNFSSEEGAEGSSIEMRLLQYASAFAFMDNNWLLGRGIGFFTIDLGGNEMGVMTGLMGLEGVLLGTILEKGLLGVFAWLILYLSIIVFALNNRNNDRYTSSFVVAVIIAYILFSNGTGDLGCSFITLLLAGLGIKLLYIKRNTDPLKCGLEKKGL